MTYADVPDFSEIIGVLAWFLEYYDQAPLIGNLIRINLTISPACPVESATGGECPLGLGASARLAPRQITSPESHPSSTAPPGVESLPGESFELRAWRPTRSSQKSQRSLPPINRVISFQSS